MKKEKIGLQADNIKCDVCGEEIDFGFDTIIPGRTKNYKKEVYHICIDCCLKTFNVKADN